jgi:hypothetical protein
VSDKVTTEQALACVAAIFPTTTIEGAGLVDLPAVSRTHFEAVLGLNNAPYPWRSERDRLAEQAEWRAFLDYLQAVVNALRHGTCMTCESQPADGSSCASVTMDMGSTFGCRGYVPRKDGDTP